MIVLMTPIQIAAHAARNIDQRRTTKDGYLVKLIGGPLHDEVRRLEHLKRLIVFTTPSGACEYIRVSKCDILTKYQHLTPELEEELEFAQEMGKLAAIDDPNAWFRWSLRHNGTRPITQLLYQSGWRWDWESREWFFCGTQEDAKEALAYARTIPEAEIFCEGA